MNSESDRKKLAEAIGYGKAGTKEPCPYCGELTDFDPFTDANDDYAVLEWMRNEPQINVVRDAFVRELRDNIEMAGTASYVIGDYARSALKVLE